MFFSATPVVERISETTQAVCGVRRCGEAITPFYKGNDLSAYVFMCVSAYCLQTTKAAHGHIQAMKKKIEIEIQLF